MGFQRYISWVRNSSVEEPAQAEVRWPKCVAPVVSPYRINANRSYAHPGQHANAPPAFAFVVPRIELDEIVALDETISVVAVELSGSIDLNSKDLDRFHSDRCRSKNNHNVVARDPRRRWESSTVGGTGYAVVTSIDALHRTVLHKKVLGSQSSHGRVCTFWLKYF